jgi:acetyl-CoA C-acetyltransferase
MAELCGVVGIGQTKYAAKRGDVSIAGLVREAALKALDDAGLDWGDVDAVVLGKAPDMFEGVIMPELYLADAVAASLIHAGIHDRVLTVSFEKQSEANTMWALSSKQPFSPHINAGAGGYFAPLIRTYMRRSKAPDHIGILVAYKDRVNALKNPLAHLHMEDISMQKIEASPMLWEPIRYLESCPASDGACAMVLAREALAKDAPRPPAWVLGTAMRSEPTMFAGREEVNPQAGKDCAADVYRQAGITDPRAQIDVAEIYVPFSWFEPMWIENLGFAEEGQGWTLTDEGCTALDGDIPINCSGGVLSTNPIGASGMIRFAEAALQVRGMAGDHQIDGARVALGHAYGGGSQFFAMWVVSSERP